MATQEATVNKAAPAQAAPEPFYVVVHTMISVPQQVKDDPLLAQNIDASFLLRGDVVGQSMLGGMHPRLLRVGAIRKATTDEGRSSQRITAIRKASNEEDSTAAASLNTTPDTHEVKA